MRQFIQKIRKAFAIFFVRRMYVITQMNAGVKYYYKGQNSEWTPIIEVAKHYKKKPNPFWLSDLFHKVEEYYA